MTIPRCPSQDPTCGLPACAQTVLCRDVAEVIITGTELRRTVARLAEQIRAAYRDDPDVLVVFLLDGAKRFAEDLAVLLNDTKFEFTGWRASSYLGTTRSSGRVRVDGSLDTVIRTRKILLVDDIYDTGLTLKHVCDHLRRTQPLDLKTCVLFEKQCAHQETVAIDFLGLTVPDAFLVGYGLDFEGRYRELGCVAILKQHGDLHHAKR